VFIIVFDLYLPFFDSMFGAKRAKKCISDLLASLFFLFVVWLFVAKHDVVVLDEKNDKKIILIYSGMECKMN